MVYLWKMVIFHILGMSSSQLLLIHIFQRGCGQPPTRIFGHGSNSRLLRDIESKNPHFAAQLLSFAPSRWTLPLYSLGNISMSIVCRWNPKIRTVWSTNLTLPPDTRSSPSEKSWVPLISLSQTFLSYSTPLCGCQFFSIILLRDLSHLVNSLYPLYMDQLLHPLLYLTYIYIYLYIFIYKYISLYIYLFI